VHVSSLKPAAPAWLHLLLAALVWTVVGGLLLFFGARWAQGWHDPAMPLVLGGALAVGALKGLLVMRRIAGRNVARIRARGDGYCLGGFVEWKAWLLVAGMVLLGRTLRSGILPTSTVGFVYAGVGAALLLGSWTLWRGLLGRGDPGHGAPASG
jgi:hypothetical protein